MLDFLFTLVKGFTILCLVLSFPAFLLGIIVRSLIVAFLSGDGLVKSLIKVINRASNA